MRIFVVGAEGATGARLATQLIDQGHQVIGTRRSSRNAGRARVIGAEPIALGQQPARVWCRIAGGC
jgi:nucleoside-diphosphate-sugar epimerase